jgi:formate hydrogenlyase subunit 3/multisubunit Na+/H+ antiporter MnhD subunit
MHPLLWPIVVPAVAGFLCLLVPRKVRAVREILAIGATLWTFLLTIGIFRGGEQFMQQDWLEFGFFTVAFDLRAYHFASFVLMFIAFFGLAVASYSASYMAGKPAGRSYYAYLLWTVAASCGAVLADNLIVLLIFWEIVTILFYLLVTLGGTKLSSAAARKSFVILGFSDCALLLGIVFLWVLGGSLSLSQLSVKMGGSLTYIAFILCTIGALAKAGAWPVHSWVPAAAEGSPTPVMAFLPASLDKLLGIYLLARISLELFIMDGAMGLMLMIIGSATIIFAVMMALVQHDLKKLLSFHAVSQVGYMVLGVGTGVPIGIMGGLFHMVNHAIYKSCLFLGAGAVEKQAKTTDLTKLGGLASAMPITFGAMFVASMSISGVPPFNGFVSKWLVYQSLVSIRQPIFLIAATFGSALTLASFIKVLYSVFWGERPKKLKNVREVGFLMAWPMAALALLCILFGVVAQFPLQRFIGPIDLMIKDFPFEGIPNSLKMSDAWWSPTGATLLMILGLMVGLVWYLLGRVTKRRRAVAFVGGESLDSDETRVVGTGFYETIRNLSGFKGVYSDADKGIFDVYFLGGRLGGLLVKALRNLHDGVLSSYLSWSIIGLGILIFLMELM